MTKIITRYFESAENAQAARSELLYRRNLSARIVRLYDKAEGLADSLKAARVNPDTADAYQARLEGGGAVLLVMAGYKPLGVAKITREVAANMGACRFGRARRGGVRQGFDETNAAYPPRPSAHADQGPVPWADYFPYGGLANTADQSSEAILIVGVPAAFAHGQPAHRVASAREHSLRPFSIRLAGSRPKTHGEISIWTHRAGPQAHGKVSIRSHRAWPQVYGQVSLRPHRPGPQIHGQVPVWASGSWRDADGKLALPTAHQW